MKRHFQGLYYQIATCGVAMGWTYKIQLQQAEKNTKLSRWIKRLAIFFSALVSISALQAALNIFNFSDDAANFITAITGVFATVFVGLDNKIDYSDLAKENIKCSAECRDIMMSYRSLLTDIKSGVYTSYEQIVYVRDSLQNKELELFKKAPITFKSAVKKAEKKLMKLNDNQTTKKEIAKILGTSFILSDEDFEDR